MLEKRYSDDFKSLNFIHYLRAIAMILICWDHLIPATYYAIGMQPPVGIAERYIIWPLAITNYFGTFGVDLFFIITGFLALYTLKKFKIISFLINRATRLLPPLLFSAVFYYILALCVRVILGVLLPAEIEAYRVANGAIWYLDVLVLFYIMFACSLPVLKRSKLAGCIVSLAICILVCWACSNVFITRPGARELGNACSYIFYIIIGMSFYILFSEQKRAFLWFCGIFAASWYGVIHFNIAVFNPERANTGNSFGVSAMYAILVFLVFYLADSRLPSLKWVNHIADYSYGMYLHHMPIYSLILPLMLQPDSTNISLRCYVIAVITILLSYLATMIHTGYVDGLFVRYSNKLLRVIDHD